MASGLARITSKRFVANELRFLPAPTDQNIYFSLLYLHFLPHS